MYVCIYVSLSTPLNYPNLLIILQALDLEYSLVHLESDNRGVAAFNINFPPGTPEHVASIVADHIAKVTAASHDEL